MIGFKQDRHRIRGLAFLTIGLSLVPAACAADTAQDTNAASTTLDALPVQTISYYEPPIGSVENLAALSDLVVLATLSEVRTDAFTYVESSAEDPRAGKISYDGYVFTPIQWVKGKTDGELVVLRETMMRRADGTPISRLQPNGYAVGRDHIGRTYLLFLARAYAGTVGELFVPSSSFFGIVEVLPDGKMLLFAPGDPQDPLHEFKDQKVEAVIARLLG